MTQQLGIIGISQEDLMAQAITLFKGHQSASDQAAYELRKHQEAALIAHKVIQQAESARMIRKMRGRGDQGKRHYIPNFGLGNPLQRVAV